MLEQSLSSCIDHIENRLRDVEISAAKQSALIELALKQSQNMQYIALGLLTANMAVLGTILAAVLHAF
jgi:hypothetical protein